MKNNIQTEEEKKSKKRSALITAVLTLLLLLLIFTYTWEIEKPQPTIEIAVLFEDNLPEPPEEPIVPKPIEKISENSSASSKASGSYKNTSASDNENSSKYKTPTPITSKTQKKPSPVKAQSNSAKKNTGKETQKKTNEVNKDVRNLLNRNRTSSNGPSTTPGNGRTDSRTDGNGDGNGVGTIGNGGRTLLSKVPGTEGDRRAPLASPCSESGLVRFAYTVDKNGNVTSVSRSGGASAACLVNTGTSWIKQYVKANKGSGSAKGSYKIDFR